MRKIIGVSLFILWTCLFTEVSHGQTGEAEVPPIKSKSSSKHVGEKGKYEMVIWNANIAFMIDSSSGHIWKRYCNEKSCFWLKELVEDINGISPSSK